MQLAWEWGGWEAFLPRAVVQGEERDPGAQLQALGNLSGGGKGAPSQAHPQPRTQLPEAQSTFPKRRKLGSTCEGDICEWE